MLRDLLDTNVCIYVIKHRPPAVREVFNRHQGQMAVSAIPQAALWHGAERSADRSRNLAVVEDFCSRLAVLPYADKAAHYGSIRADLERQGKPIGVNDLRIAAQARSEGLVLVSNSLREFERVAGLRLENWVAAA